MKKRRSQLAIVDTTWAGLLQQALDGWLKEPNIDSNAAELGERLLEHLIQEIG